MAAANVLLVGLKGLGVEIAKNLILGGLGSVTLLDGAPVELRDLGASSAGNNLEKSEKYLQKEKSGKYLLRPDLSQFLGAPSLYFPFFFGRVPTSLFVRFFVASAGNTRWGLSCVPFHSTINNNIHSSHINICILGNAQARNSTSTSRTSGSRARARASPNSPTSIATFASKCVSHSHSHSLAHDIMRCNLS